MTLQINIGPSLDIGPGAATPSSDPEPTDETPAAMMMGL